MTRYTVDEPDDGSGLRLVGKILLYALVGILMVAVAVSAVGWYSNRRLEQVIPPRVLDRIETHARLAAAGFESYVSGVSNDVASYRAAPGVIGLIRTLGLQTRTEPMVLYGPKGAKKVLGQAIQLGVERVPFNVKR